VLRGGVTGISQPGGSYYIGVALRDAIRDGIVQGPRMTSAGRYLSTSNGLTDWFPDSVGVPEGSIGIVHNRLADMIDEVRHQVKNGVDLIKLADSPYGDFQALTTDEMKTLADLAHQLGKKITIHARGFAEVDAAVAAGMDWIMHGNILTDETVAHLAESGTPLVPTLLLLAKAGDWGHLVGAPVPLRDGMKEMLERSADALHRGHAAGVPMVLGTDSGFSLTPYGVWRCRGSAPSSTTRSPRSAAVRWRPPATATCSWTPPVASPGRPPNCFSGCGRLDRGARRRAPAKSSGWMSGTARTARSGPCSCARSRPPVAGVRLVIADAHLGLAQAVRTAAGCGGATLGALHAQRARHGAQGERRDGGRVDPHHLEPSGGSKTARRGHVKSSGGGVKLRLGMSCRRCATRPL
jgi:hypothetical protein